MAESKFIFLSPSFNASEFMRYLNDMERDERAIEIIIDSFKDLKKVYWHGNREETIRRCKNDPRENSLRRLLKPVGQIRSFVLDQYIFTIKEILLFLSNGPKEALEQFLLSDYSSIQPNNNAGKVSGATNLKPYHRRVIYSRGFHIPFNSNKDSEQITNLLIERGVDRSIIPEILKTLELVSSKVWYHANTSYDRFKWDAPDIDKYVNGLFYDEYGNKMRPDYKIKQAIKHLIESRQIQDNNEVSPSLSRIEGKFVVPEESGQGKQHLVVELNLTDQDEFFGFLMDRPINYQTRERYVEDTPAPKKPEHNSNRSTFVGHGVAIDKNSIDVYVNGSLSTDVVCKVLEYNDAYVLQLYVKGVRQYRKVYIDKEQAKEPIRRIHFDEEGNAWSLNGKNLAVTFEGYDAYKRSIEDKPDKEDFDKPSSIYIGQPDRERITQLSRQTSVEKTDEEVTVKIDLQPKTESIQVTEDANSEQVDVIPAPKTTETVNQTDIVPGDNLNQKPGTPGVSSEKEIPEVITGGKIHIRLYYCIAVIGLIILGLLSRRFENIPEACGDAIWAMMVFCCWRIVLTRRKLTTVAITAFITSYAVEFSQILSSDCLLKIRSTFIGHMLLGQGFLWTDLIAYTIGIIIIYIIASFFE